MNIQSVVSFCLFFFYSISANGANDYQYIDYALGISDLENTQSNGDYESFSGSFIIQDQTFLAFEANNYHKQGVYDIDLTGFGIGSYTDFGRATDLYALLQLIVVDLENNNDKRGLRLSLGVRSSISSRMELAGKIYYEDVYEKSSKSYALALRYYVTTDFSAGLGYDMTNIAEDDMNHLYAALRLNF
ncbi:hypothetical protein [Marinomonas sp. THO17]|uniref:hypothetical protein n=1 Tax=Marinomonas sp. THO17 TaxID=3149048 RepID=UPI00336C1167